MSEPEKTPPTETIPSGDAEDIKALSPSAEAFFPKWKRSGKDSEDDEDKRGELPFSNDFGRSLSGNMPSRLHSGGGSGRGRGNGSMGGSYRSPMRREASGGFNRQGSGAWGEGSGWQGGPGTPGGNGEESKASKAITVEHRMIKVGSYSTWIRVLSADIGPAQLASVLSRCEESNSKGAIHVYLREKFINRQLVQQLKSQGYKFHHYVEETQTFVYGKRPQDVEDGKELMNATAKELIGALILSPDEQQVLMMWEGGKWTFVSGYTITRESVVDALKREIRSQLNLEIDKAYVPRVVGGWNRASAKFDCINEMFFCFALKATTSTFTVEDGVYARWFQVDELLQLLEMVDAQFKELNVEPKLDSAIEHPPGNIFSHLALRWVKVLKEGKGWEATSVAERHVFCAV